MDHIPPVSGSTQAESVSDDSPSQVTAQLAQAFKNLKPGMVSDLPKAVNDLIQTTFKSAIASIPHSSPQGQVLTQIINSINMFQSIEFTPSSPQGEGVEHGKGSGDPEDMNYYLLSHLVTTTFPAILEEVSTPNAAAPVNRYNPQEGAESNGNLTSSLTDFEDAMLNPNTDFSTFSSDLNNTLMSFVLNYPFDAVKNIATWTVPIRKLSYVLGAAASTSQSTYADFHSNFNRANNNFPEYKTGSGGTQTIDSLALTLKWGIEPLAPPNTVPAPFPMYPPPLKDN